MKKLLILIFSSLLFSAEMEVDGNLKVTGSVESTTIDRLKAVIAQLEVQMQVRHGIKLLSNDELFIVPDNINTIFNNIEYK